MKRVTKSRINAIQNAGTMIDSLDFFSELSDSEIEDHQEIGKLLIKHAEEVVRFLISINQDQ